MEVDKLTEKLQGVGIASASADGPVVRGRPKMCDLCYLMTAIFKTEGLLTNSGGMAVNDTAGTLALGHFRDEHTLVAVIIGTGTNAWYVERTDAIIKTQGLITNSGGIIYFVVNTEWGNFWSSHLPKTSYNNDLYAESPNPYSYDQGFGKMISGMYLGDTVRRVLFRMPHESDIFGELSSSLWVPLILRIPLMAAMDEDDSPDLREVTRILNDMPHPNLIFNEVKTPL
ncbi:hexokinase-3-like [Papaver somniferum]|uniref:hexokinase-3-like n=1 Tax=Papaver somniferum TaxID=3469 RepID=UPI000E6FDDF9|nr:hexokinase-3-like [Papaver somniferum]